jgi:poly-gamma-glutamate capsule biosynthesis protein CapA/YwtB (metallophosphatase superfamily)
MKLINIFILFLSCYVVSANVLLTFAGDLNASVIPIDNKGSEKIFTSVSDILKRDDLTIVNLECPISNKGTAEKDKLFTFRANPEVAPILYRNGIEAVSIANNHSLDYGTEAFKDTLKNLQNSGIKYSGGGLNNKTLVNPVINIRDTKVKLIAASRVLPDTTWAVANNRPGLVSIYNPEKTIEQIKTANKDDSLFIVAYIHWGKEKEINPDKTQTKLAHQLIDAGADAVIGSHPHVLQGFEWYKGKLIAYSLGNFIFSCSSRTTMMLQFELDKNKVVNVKVIPVNLSKKIPKLLNKEKDKQKVYTYLTNISENIFIDSSGKIKPRKKTTKSAKPIAGKSIRNK